MNFDQRVAPRNAILRALPREELERLAPCLKTTQLTEGERVYAIDEPISKIWFLETAVVSRLVQVATGETVEAGIVGSDGVVGLPIVLGSSTALGQCAVQQSGSAYYMLAPDFDEHVRDARSPLYEALLIYVNGHISTLAQLAACHSLHRIEQRLSRCILQLGDYTEANRIRITHDMLAEFLGVHRPSVTYALQALASTGAISLERRSVIILDRDALHARACECYNTIARVHARELRRMRDLQPA